MRKYIELTEYYSNGRTVIFADSIQGLCRVRDGECNKEFTEVMVSGYTFIVNEPIDEILERMEKEQSSYNSIKTELNGDTINRQAVIDAMQKNHRSGGRDIDGDYIEGDYRECLYDDIISLPSVNTQKCDNCEVGNPCLYCRHEFEPQERSGKE